MPSPPSTQPGDARERRSFAFDRGSSSPWIAAQLLAAPAGQPSTVSNCLDDWTACSARSNGGNLRVWTRIEDVAPLITSVEHLVERTNSTVLAAACIVALAIVMQCYRPEGWRAWIRVVYWIAVAAAVMDSVRTCGPFASARKEPGSLGSSAGVLH
jgi:hypothetical protein